MLFLNGCKIAKKCHSEHFWVQKWSPQCWKLVIMKKKFVKKIRQKKVKMPKMALFCALHFSTEQNICFGHIVRQCCFHLKSNCMCQRKIVYLFTSSAIQSVCFIIGIEYHAYAYFCTYLSNTMYIHKTELIISSCW